MKIKKILNKIKQKIKEKQQGFTLIEIMVVIVILAMASIALSMTAKSMVLANQRFRNVQTVQSHAQEAAQYFTKVIRMSESKKEDRFQGQEYLQIKWRKLDSTNNTFDTVELCFQENSHGPCPAANEIRNLDQFFPDEDMQIENLAFYGGGKNWSNRVTMVFTVEKGTDEAIKVSLPIQVTVSLRE